MWYDNVPDMRAVFDILISERGKHKKPQRKQNELKERGYHNEEIQ